MQMQGTWFEMHGHTLKDCSNFIVPFEENESDESDSNCNDSESEEEY